jgi:hypothetical protein
MVLHRQPSLKDPARKPWEAILGSRYFGPATVVKAVVGEGCVAFDCTSQENAPAQGHVDHRVQEGSKNGVPKRQLLSRKMSVVGKIVAAVHHQVCTAGVPIEPHQAITWNRAITPS